MSNTLIIFEQIIVMWHLSMFSGTRTTSQLGGLLSDWLNNLQTRYRIQSECLLRMLLHICGSRPRCLTNETSFETFIGWIVVVVNAVLSLLCLFTLERSRTEVKLISQYKLYYSSISWLDNIYYILSIRQLVRACYIWLP